MQMTSDIRKAATAALAPLFGDPWIPPFMRETEKVFDAVGVCPTFGGIDPARGPGALAAASRLHPELRVPGALFFMGELGKIYLDGRVEAGKDGYLQAHPAMSWPTWFCSDLPEHPFALAQILDNFAWRAAAALLPPRAETHSISLAAPELFPGLAKAQAVDGGWFDAAAFGAKAIKSFDLFSEGPLGTMKSRVFDDEAKKDVMTKVGDSIVRSLARSYGEDNAIWLARTAAEGFADGFDEVLDKEIASGGADPWRAASVGGAFVVHAAAKAGAKCRTGDGSAIKAEVLFELGPARSARMLFAARASLPTAVREYQDLPEWLRPPTAPSEAKTRKAPRYPDVYFGRTAGALCCGTGDGISAVIREHSVPGVFREQSASKSFLEPDVWFWRFAGVWRWAAKSLGWEPGAAEGGDTEGFKRETAVFGAACAAVVRADFLAEWYKKCAVLPGRLFVAALAETFGEWAKDGRLFGAGAHEARDYFTGNENPVGRLTLKNGTRHGLLSESAFTSKSAAAETARRISVLIGSGSAREEGSRTERYDYVYDLEREAAWDGALDAGMAELSEAAASIGKKASLAAEAMAQRRIAFPDVEPAAGGVRAALEDALSKAGYRDLRESEIKALADDADKRLGDDAGRFAGFAAGAAEAIRALAAGAPEGSHAGVWAVGKMLARAAEAKSRRAANAAAAMGVEGRKLALAAQVPAA